VCYGWVSEKPDMSARQFDVSPQRDSFVPSLGPTVSSEPLSLPAAAVRIRRNGIEFHYSKPLAPWTEAEVRVSSPGGTRPLTCTGVVVRCTGSARTGYHVSMVLVGLAPRNERQLAALSHSQLS